MVHSVAINVSPLPMHKSKATHRVLVGLFFQLLSRYVPVDWCDVILCHKETPLKRDISKVVQRVCALFHLKLASAKAFLYQDGEAWRPFHQDAHALSRALRQTQDISCIAGFGSMRTLRFEHLGEQSPAEEFDLPNGSVLAFGARVNEHYRHGLPQSLARGRRISVAVWGMSPAGQRLSL